MISVLYLKKYFRTLLTFSPCSHIFLLTSVIMTAILSNLSGKSYSFFPAGCFWKLILFFYLWHLFLIPPSSWPLFVCLCTGQSSVLVASPQSSRVQRKTSTSPPGRRSWELLQALSLPCRKWAAFVLICLFLDKPGGESTQLPPVFSLRQPNCAWPVRTSKLLGKW